MSQHSTEPRAWLLANVNGALWAFGNGLVSTSLVIYLAKELGATGTHVGWILALPHLAGVLRLGVPSLLGVKSRRKAWTLRWFLLSGFLLCLLPLLALPAIRQQPFLARGLLVFIWGCWHVSMYCGLVPYFSWLGDLSSGADRAPRLAMRETCMTSATMLGTLSAAGLTTLWLHFFPSEQLLPVYVLITTLGAFCILLSVLPVWFMPEIEGTMQHLPAGAMLLQACCDRRYLPLLAFQACFSFTNGITGAAVGMYPYRILGLSLATLLFAQTYMRLMQTLTAPVAGWWLTGKQVRYVLMGAQMIAATGLLFYYMGTKQAPYWFWGAWTCWIAYVVLNIGLPNEMLRLAPGENAPAYIAVNMALGGIVFGAASILGGYLIEHLPQRLEQSPTSILANMMLIGFVLRFLTAFWLLWLPNSEPTA